MTVNQPFDYTRSNPDDPFLLRKVERAPATSSALIAEAAQFGPILQTARLFHSGCIKRHGRIAWFSDIREVRPKGSR